MDGWISLKSFNLLQKGKKDLVAPEVYCEARSESDFLVSCWWFYFNLARAPPFHVVNIADNVILKQHLNVRQKNLIYVDA